MPAAAGQVLAATGRTGPNTDGPVTVSDPVSWVALEFVVEVAGSTPTITAKLQGSFAPSSTAAGAYVDCQLLPSASDTSVSSFTQTGVGTYVYFVSLSHSRMFRHFQLVTSANTNVTYRANLYALTNDLD